jgi:hypothetical protein
VVAPVAADAEITIDAVTELAPAVMIAPLTPALPDTTADAPDSVVPVKVTVSVVPTVPVAGVTDVTVVVPETVVKESMYALASEFPARSVTPPARTVNWYCVPAVSGADGVKVRVLPLPTTAPATEVPPVASNTFSVFAVPTLIGLLNVTEIADVTATPVAPLAGAVPVTVGAI